MRRHIVLICSLAVIAVLSVWAFAEGGASKLTRLAPPIDDSAIQKCIEDKLAGSATLKANGISVAVTNGVATLTGHVKNNPFTYRLIFRSLAVARMGATQVNFNAEFAIS